VFKKIKNYLVETVDELQNKVSWPTWAELQSSSLVVLIASFMIALLIFGMDSGASAVLKLLYE